MPPAVLGVGKELFLGLVGAPSQAPFPSRFPVCSCTQGYVPAAPPWGRATVAQPPPALRSAGAANRHQIKSTPSPA